MDTTPPPSETITSTSIGGSVNKNLGDIEDKDAEMSQLEQNSSNCNNMNINKRARQISGQRNTSATSNVGHRSTAVPSFGMVGGNTGVSPVVERSTIRDHRMSVSDSGDSEPLRPSDLDSETVRAPSAEPVGPSGGSVVSAALESDGDVRTDDDEEVCFSAPNIALTL